MTEKPKTFNQPGHPFDGAPIISSYTSADAVDDGLFVPIGPGWVVTAAALAALERGVPEGDKPPNRWPVEMMGWFMGKTDTDKALALAKGMVGDHGRNALKVYADNIGGGILNLFALTDAKGKFTSLESSDTGSDRDDAVRFWLMPNDDRGGLILMLPSDY